MERIAISGSRGFIGSNLAKCFGEFERLTRSSYVVGNPEVVFDLAAFGNMAYHDQDPKVIYRANLNRVMNVLDSTSKDTKIVYVSTSSVKLPHQTFYSASKRATEEMLKIEARDNGRRIAIVRPFTVVGVGEQKEHLIPKLIDSCLNGNKMPFVGEPKHDFIDVDDMVSALVTISKTASFVGEVYEVGSGLSVSNNEVKQMVEDETGQKASVDVVDTMRAYDSSVWVADTASISRLGWKPEFTIRDTIRKMINYERQNN